MLTKANILNMITLNAATKALRPMIFRSFFAILAMFPVGAAAQTVGQEPLNFNEELRTEAQISGALFAGLQRSVGRPQMRNTTVHVEVPQGWAGGVACLRVRSSNGLYDSIAEYALGADGTLVALQFPTAHAAFLAERPAGGVAALVTRGDCGEQQEESAVVRWDAADDTPVTLFLNAFRADRVYVYLGDAPDPVECTPLSDEGRTAYDVRCNIGTVEAAGAIDLEVFSVTNGQPSDTARLTLLPMATR